MTWIARTESTEFTEQLASVYVHLRRTLLPGVINVIYPEIQA